MYNSTKNRLKMCFKIIELEINNKKLKCFKRWYVGGHSPPSPEPWSLAQAGEDSISAVIFLNLCTTPLWYRRETIFSSLPCCHLPLWAPLSIDVSRSQCVPSRTSPTGKPSVNLLISRTRFSPAKRSSLRPSLRRNLTIWLLLVGWEVGLLVRLASQSKTMSIS